MLFNAHTAFLFVTAMVVGCVLFLGLFGNQQNYSSFSFAVNLNDTLSFGCVQQPFEIQERNMEAMTTGRETDNSKTGINPDMLRYYYEGQAARRSAALGAINMNSNFAILYNVLVPEAYCPNLVRIGNVLDGGKWICNPSSIPSNCSIYSLGLNEQISFDEEIQTFNNNSCTIVGYDQKMQSAMVQSRYTAINGRTIQATLGAETNKSLHTLSPEDMLQENNSTKIEIMKMDIESTEYQFLPPLLDRIPMCQILLELHGSSLQMITLLREISKHDYWLYSYEVNGDSMRACEFSFIHTSCMEQYGLFPLARYLSLSG